MGRGEVTVPYATGPDGTAMFSVESLQAESLLVTVFHGAPEQAELFRKWLTRAEVWEQFARWQSGHPYPQAEDHATACASKMGCTCAFNERREAVSGGQA